MLVVTVIFNFAELPRSSRRTTRNRHAERAGPLIRRRGRGEIKWIMLDDGVKAGGASPRLSSQSLWPYTDEA